MELIGLGASLGAVSSQETFEATLQKW